MSTPVQAHRLVSSDRVIGTDVYGVSEKPSVRLTTSSSRRSPAKLLMR